MSGGRGRRRPGFCERRRCGGGPDARAVAAPEGRHPQAGLRERAVPPRRARGEQRQERAPPGGPSVRGAVCSGSDRGAAWGTGSGHAAGRRVESRPPWQLQLLTLCFPPGRPTGPQTQMRRHSMPPPPPPAASTSTCRLLASPLPVTAIQHVFGWASTHPDCDPGDRLGRCCRIKPQGLQPSGRPAASAPPAVRSTVSSEASEPFHALSSAQGPDGHSGRSCRGPAPSPVLRWRGVWSLPSGKGTVPSTTGTQEPHRGPAHRHHAGSLREPHAQPTAQPET